MTHWNDSSQRVKKQKAYYNTNLQSKQPKKIYKLYLKIKTKEMGAGSGDSRRREAFITDY